MIVDISIDGFKVDVKIVADTVGNFVKLHDDVVDVDANKFVNQIKDIVKFWPAYLENVAIRDGSWYTIKLIDGVNEKVFKGRNKYPNNYNEFLNLIHKVKNANKKQES